MMWRVSSPCVVDDRKEEALVAYACDMHGEAITIDWKELFFVGKDYETPKTRET